MDWDAILLLIHVASAAAWFGSGVTLVVLSTKARRDGALFSFVRQMEWVGPRVGPPVSLGVVITGVWMVARRGGFGFGDGWILGGLAGFVVLLGIGIGFHARQYKRIDETAARLGEDSEEVASLISGSIRAAQLEIVLLAIVMYLMVFKPGG